MTIAFHWNDCHWNVAVFPSFLGHIWESTFVFHYYLIIHAFPDGMNCNVSKHLLVCLTHPCSWQRLPNVLNEELTDDAHTVLKYCQGVNKYELVQLYILYNSIIFLPPRAYLGRTGQAVTCGPKRSPPQDNLNNSQIIAFMISHVPWWRDMGPWYK